ncbi:MAG: DUF501 domain-containing protein, partial [Bifidobacteriaceae bacterium]|nr:DUF501 domain-containing protein [Bifidobacteriaceae bacterium]
MEFNSGSGAGQVTAGGVTAGGITAGQVTAAQVPQADRSRPEVTPQDLLTLKTQLGREPRGVVQIAARCRCGAPLVARTAPRLPDGTPFPTTYYLTHPVAAKAIGRLESRGVMVQMNQQLAQDPDLAQAYRRAHLDYLERRAQLGRPPEIEGISAGGMPERVKCLHVLAAHALAVGPGANLLGDAVLVAIAPRWRPDRCQCGPAAGSGIGPRLGSGRTAGVDPDTPLTHSTSATPDIPTTPTPSAPDAPPTPTPSAPTTPITTPSPTASTTPGAPPIPDIPTAP